MKRAIFCVALLFFLATPSAEVFAQVNLGAILKPSAGKLRLKVNRVDGYPTNGGYKWVFEGAVSVSRDDWSLSCDRLVLITRNDPAHPGAKLKKEKRSLAALNLEELKSARATGNVKNVYKNTIAMSGQASYNAANRTVTLSGGSPKVWHGKDMMRARTIVLRLDDN